MEIYKTYGIRSKLVDAINILCQDSLGQLLTFDGGTEFFEYLQEFSLAPFLFIVDLDYALYEATRKTHIGFKLTKFQSSRHPATYITDTNFADVIALLSNTLEEAQFFLLRLEKAAEAIGLHVNYKKSEYMFYN